MNKLLHLIDETCRRERESTNDSDKAYYNNVRHTLCRLWDTLYKWKVDDMKMSEKPLDKHVQQDL